MRCSAHVRPIDEDRCSQKGLYQVPGFVDSWRAVLPWVSVLQDVDQWRCLLALKEVDDAHEVVEECELWIHGSHLTPSTADALALLAAAQ